MTVGRHAWDVRKAGALAQGEVPEGKKGYFELPVFNYFEARRLRSRKSIA